MHFFEEAFSWKFDEFRKGDYWYATTGDDKSRGINGSILRKREPGMPVINSINVENIDDAIKKIEKAGGRLVKPKRPIEARGWLAFFTDPDGNVHGIWQDDRSAKENQSVQKKAAHA